MENNIWILNENDLEKLLNRKGCKYVTVKTICKKCNETFYSNPKRLSFSGFFCKSCKISQTKKNKPEETKKEIQEKRKQTCLQKYGVDSVSKVKDFKLQPKIEKTIKEKISLGTPVSQDLENLKITKWEKRTEDQRKDILEKRKTTNLKKYGNEFAQRTETVKQHYIENSLKKWGTKTPSIVPEIRQKRENTCKARYGTKHSTGHYQFEGEVFDSSWELALWIYAKDHNLEIEREPILIDYEFNGNKHTYYPDFRFEGKLIELKGEQFFDKSGKMINPFDHSQNALTETKHQAGLQNGVQFWRYNEIKPYLEYLQNNYPKNYLQTFLKLRK